MTTASPMMDKAKRIAKSKPSIVTYIIIALALIYLIYAWFKVMGYVDKLKLALTPPTLPQTSWQETNQLNSAGWPNQSADWFRFATQGTPTLPIPYSWLMALEQPKSHPYWAIIGKEAPLFMGEYVYGHGFIKSPKNAYNPDNLPIGFTKTPSIYFPGLDRHAEAIGFTCAACHTGQFTHNGTRYIVDGGPATTDLGLFGKSLGAALGQTELSGKFNILNGRFNRFAKRVLGSNDNLLTRARLKSELTATLDQLKTTSDVIETTEGFSRNDALNRIGNQVFSKDFAHSGNYAAINAPVNYPHIWTTSWFDWVQYDGSIMQPLIRNSGEALGLKAYLNTTAPDDQRFASSINVPNLVEMEKWLSGTNPRANGDQFTGLQSPKWPVSLSKIDPIKVAQGAKLYSEFCAGCHMPAVTDNSFWQDKYWQKIGYYQKNGTYQQTEEAYLHLKIIPLDEIGTDPNQAHVLAQRTVNTTGLNINTQVCILAEEGGKKTLKYVDVEDSATASFAYSLGGVVNRANEQWFKQNYVSDAQRASMEDDRPNCLQAGQGYKARPLNGVWATAPFLHNGSVATLYDLLLPAAERPTFVELGNIEMDTKNVGLTQGKYVQQLNQASASQKAYHLLDDYAKDGYFILDTRQAGNHNSGHSFEGDHKGYAKNGIVGRALTEEERYALIEYLKTL